MFLSLNLFLVLTSISAQQKGNNRQLEVLGRGIVAVRIYPEEVFISWRLLGTDPSEVGFNLYRGKEKINKKPLTLTTTYTDKTSADESYSVKAIIKGKEQKEVNRCRVWQRNYLKIQLNRPPAGRVSDLPPADRRQYTYSPGDASVADLDGDGKAELACKTADGTIDGKGYVIGDSTKNWINEKGKIVAGPEFLTVFNGLTGEAMKTVDYIPGRGDQCKWGNNECNGNRVDRFLACIAYLDGVHPSLLMGRGYYGRLTIAAWDYVNHKPVRLLDASVQGGSSINGTKATPVISADILGDWREEVIFRGNDNSSIILFTTTIQTEYRIKTLMHDQVYRLGIAWQNVVYNQPPHLGFYIGDGVGINNKK